MKRTHRASCDQCGFVGTMTSPARAEWAQRQHRCTNHLPRERTKRHTPYSYHKLWHHERAHGLTRTTDATLVRAHLQQLRDAGWTNRSIAEVTGLSPSTVLHVYADGNPRVYNRIANLILAVTPHTLHNRPNDDGFVPRIGSVRRIQALIAIGWRHQDINAVLRESGVRTSSAMILSQVGDLCTRRTAAAVRAAYEQLSMTAGPSRINVGWAERLGYLPPLAWDDDTIDDPLAEPNQVDTDRADELDDVLVERLIAGTATVPPNSQSPELLAAVRHLAERGYSAAQIGERVGRSAAATGQMCRRHGITTRGVAA